MQTLNEIASSLGVSLQTIYNRKAEAEERLGYEIKGQKHPTDKRKTVYDAEAIALITGQPTQAIEIANPAAVTIETGNHRQALNQPNMSDLAFNLERFRAEDTESWVFEDVDAVADQFLAVADQLVAGMDADIKAREQRLKATRDAQGKVTDKARELQLEQRLYRDRARDLDMAQTEHTQSLQEAVEALRSLGKPTDADAAATGG